LKPLEERMMREYGAGDVLLADFGRFLGVDRGWLDHNLFKLGMQYERKHPGHYLVRKERDRIKVSAKGRMVALHILPHAPKVKAENKEAPKAEPPKPKEKPKRVAKPREPVRDELYERGYSTLRDMSSAVQAHPGTISIFLWNVQHGLGDVGRKYGVRENLTVVKGGRTYISKEGQRIVKERYPPRKPPQETGEGGV